MLVESAVEIPIKNLRVRSAIAELALTSQLYFLLLSIDGIAGIWYSFAEKLIASGFAFLTYSYSPIPIYPKKAPFVNEEFFLSRKRNCNLYQSVAIDAPGIAGCMANSSLTSVLFDLSLKSFLQLLNMIVKNKMKSKEMFDE